MTGSPLEDPRKACNLPCLRYYLASVTSKIAKSRGPNICVDERTQICRSDAALPSTVCRKCVSQSQKFSVSLITRSAKRATFLPSCSVAWPPRSSLRLLSRGKCRVDAFSHTNPLYRTIRQHFLYQFSSSTSKTKSLFSLKKMPRMRADFFFSVAIETYWFYLFFPDPAKIVRNS